MNEAKIIDEIRTSTGWSMGVIRDVVTALKQRGLLIDDGVVARVSTAIGNAYARGEQLRPSGKDGETLAREALFPPKPDPFEVAAAEVLSKIGFGGEIDYLKKWQLPAFTTMVEALRKAPKP